MIHLSKLIRLRLRQSFVVGLSNGARILLFDDDKEGSLRVTTEEAFIACFKAGD